MPKVVDHDVRREQVLAAVWRVIARTGLRGATTRLIAKEAGFSNGVLAHYFTNKDDILTSAMQLSHLRIRERWETKLTSVRGLSALRELLLDNLPLDEERELETKLEVSFWARTLGDKSFAEAQRLEEEELYDAIQRRLKEARDMGQLRACSDGPELTERLVALIDGLSLHALLYPQRVNAQMVVAVIDRELEQLGLETE